MAVLLCLAFLISSCNWRKNRNASLRESDTNVSEVKDSTVESNDWVTDCVESRRSDTLSRKKMSVELSNILGINVICTDPVTYIFDGSGRRFHWNSFYGDILEIPNDWIPSLSIYGLAFSYHGAPICSPDSTCWLVPYSSYTAVYIDEEEFYEGVQKEYEEDSLSFHRGQPIYQTLPNGERKRVHWAEGVSKDGCTRKKYYWSISIEGEEPTVDYTITMKVLPNTPYPTKKQLRKYYDDYPHMIFYE